MPVDGLGPVSRGHADDLSDELLARQDVRPHRVLVDLVDAVLERPLVLPVLSGNSMGFFQPENSPNFGPKTGPKCHLKRMHA